MCMFFVLEDRFKEMQGNNTLPDTSSSCLKVTAETSCSCILPVVEDWERG